jgi:hypothetical protein
VLALSVGQLLTLTEFQPDEGVIVPVETEHRSDLGLPEELLKTPRSKLVEVGVPTQYEIFETV